MARASARVRPWVLVALYAGLRAARDRGAGAGADLLRQGHWFEGLHGQPIGPETVSNGVAKLFREVGIRDGGVHRLRHTYAARPLRAGVNVRTVQRLMRHPSLATTAGYMGVDDDELRDVIGRLL